MLSNRSSIIKPQKIIQIGTVLGAEENGRRVEMIKKAYESKKN